MLTRGTSYYQIDEPCLGLYEINLQAPNYEGFHRYQILHLIRDDKIAEYRHDMGFAKKFKGVDQIRIPGGVIYESGRIEICHTVGELQDIADHMRGNSSFDKRELAQVNKINY